MDLLVSFFKKHVFHHDINAYLALSLTLLVLILCTGLINFLAKNFLARLPERFLKRTKNDWLSLISRYAVLDILSKLLPAFFMYWGIQIIQGSQTHLAKLIINTTHTLALIFILWIITRALSTAIDVVYQHHRTRNSQHKPIKGYAQILKILLWFIAIIFAVSIFLNKSPWVFLTGLGAISAVLVILFKDTILGFVANIQVSAYDLVREGDWITIAQRGVDGTVFDISVNTVKVRNFDNTIATIPTYDLVSCNVQNWRGMTESGMRRIKRAIKLDMNSIHFVNEADIQAIENSDKLKPEAKTVFKKYLEDYQQQNISLSNVAMLRLYLHAYLSCHKDIDSRMTLLVRYLEPSETGLPLEIYVFANTVIWESFEDITARILEHAIGVLPIFKIKPLQLNFNNE